MAQREFMHQAVFPQITLKVVLDVRFIGGIAKRGPVEVAKEMANFNAISIFCGTYSLLTIFTSSKAISFHSVAPLALATLSQRQLSRRLGPSTGKQFLSTGKFHTAGDSLKHLFTVSLFNSF